MSEHGEAVVFRVSKRVYVIVGVFVGLFAALGILIMIKEPTEGMFFAIDCTVGVVLFAGMSRLRLEIRHDGIHFRNLTSNRFLSYTDIAGAYLKVVTTRKAPQGVAAFWLRTKDGRRTKINLRSFPIQAAALLFTELERRDIPIDIPDHWTARRMVSQIRACQEQLLQRV